MVSDPISSPANPRIKSLVRLRNRRERDSTGTFLIEGYRELTRALEAGVQIESLFVCRGLFLGANEPALADRIVDSGAELVEVAEQPFAKASYRDRPEGLLAVAGQFPTVLSDLTLGTECLVLIVEGIEKPGNLGTMLRTAAAAAATAVIVADPTTDPFNPNVIRASLGTVFSVPLAITDSESAIRHLRQQEVTIVATTPDADRAHYETDLTAATALAVGSEQYGLSAAWLEAADTRVVIPMPGEVDSLNAAMAAGVVLFEALRQRG